MQRSKRRGRGGERERGRMQELGKHCPENGMYMRKSYEFPTI
jgi:hypothetical protein